MKSGLNKVHKPVGKDHGDSTQDGGTRSTCVYSYTPNHTGDVPGVKEDPRLFSDPWKEPAK